MNPWKNIVAQTSQADDDAIATISSIGAQVRLIGGSFVTEIENIGFDFKPRHIEKLVVMPTKSQWLERFPKYSGYTWSERSTKYLIEDLNAIVIHGGQRFVEDYDIQVVLDHISELTNLRQVTFQFCDIDDENIESVTNSRIQDINLSCTDVSDAAVEHVVGNLVNLRSIDLSNTKISNRSLKVLGNLKYLESLSIAGTEIDELKGETLGHIQSLKQLQLHSTNIGDKDLAAVGKLENLERLEISDTKITNFDAIIELSALSQIYADNTKINDESFIRLGLISSLRLVCCRNTNVSSSAIDTLKRLRPDIKLVMDE